MDNNNQQPDQNPLEPQQPVEPIQNNVEEQPAPPITEFAKPTPKPIPPTDSPSSESLPEYHKSSKSPWIKLIIAVVIIIIITFLIILFLPKGAPQKVKLSWWGLWEDPATMQSVISDFERENPNIDVEYSKQDPKQYRERLIARTGTDSGPDIFYFHNTWYPMIADIASPLPSDVISPEDFKKTYYPVMQKDLIHNGAIYGIPAGADTVSLFVNADLLSAAGIKVPANWDEFVKAAKTLTVRDPNNEIKTSGAALGTYGNITHASDVISLLFAQQGVDFNKFSTYQSDQTDVLDFYTSFAKGDDRTWDNTQDSSIVLFSQGKLAMYFGYSWDIFAIQKLNKDLKFEIYPVPSLFDRKTTIASYWVNGISAKSSHQKEAFSFIKYLSQKETSQKIFTESSKTRGFGSLYARTDLADSLKSNKLVYPFVSQLPQATSSFFASDTSDGEGGLNTSSNIYLNNAINSIVDDKSSTATAVSTLNEGVAQVFSKYAIQ